MLSRWFQGGLKVSHWPPPNLNFMSVPFGADLTSLTQSTCGVDEAQRPSTLIMYIKIQLLPAIK